MLAPLLALSGFVFYGALLGADLASTRYAMAAAPPGTRIVEGNPLLGGSLLQQVLVKSAVAAGMGALERKVPPRKRWIPRALMGALYAGIVWHNVTLPSRARAKARGEP